MKKGIIFATPVLFLALLFVLSFAFPFHKVATTMVIREFGSTNASTYGAINAYQSVGSRYNSQLIGSPEDLVDTGWQNLVIVLISMEATNISPLSAYNIEAWITSAPDGITVWKEGTTVVEEAISHWSHADISLMTLIMRRDGQTDQEIHKVVSEMKVDALF